MSKKSFSIILGIILFFTFSFFTSFLNAAQLPEQLEQYDLDNDGLLNETEEAAAQTARIAEFRLKMESNPEMAAKVIEKLDTDNDGQLSDEEIAAGGKNRTSNKEFTAEKLAEIKESLENDSRMKARALSKFDADGDGELSDSEIETMYEQKPEKGRGGRGGRGGGRGSRGNR